jgi:hypothetical protein
MAKTLDELKEMNLQVGESIELEINSQISIPGVARFKSEGSWKELGYFQGLTEDKNPQIEYSWNTGNNWNSDEPTEIRRQEVSRLENVRRLQYVE